MGKEGSLKADEYFFYNLRRTSVEASRLTWMSLDESADDEDPWAAR